VDTVQQHLRAANGTVIPVIGKTKLAVSHGLHEMEIDGLVSCHVSGVILGLDWLKRHHAVWNFPEEKINLDGRSYKLSYATSGTWCRRVVVQDEVVVPPRSELVLPTLVEYNDLSFRPPVADIIWSTEAAEPVSGLCVSRTLVPPRPDRVPVLVMNVTKQSIALKAGEVISDLHSVQSHEQVQDDDAAMGDESEQPLRALVDALDPYVPDDNREELYRLLREFRGAFSFKENDLGRMSIVGHTIDTSYARPVRQALRRHPPAIIWQ